MQNKLNKVISKIDDEIESKIILNKQMNDRTFDTFMFLQNNINEINLKMSKYSLNKRHSELKEYLKDAGYTYDEDKLKWYLFRNGYFNEFHKTIIHLCIPLLIGIIALFLAHFNISAEYFVIIFANVTIIATLIITTVMEQ